MKKILSLLTLFIFSFSLIACQTSDPSIDEPSVNEPTKTEENPIVVLDDDNRGVYYQIFVRSFADSNNDGVGDIQGIISKLDYLEDLGIYGIWLLPIHPSDSYHGYDVKDYYSIHEDYGTMEDFEELIAQANARGIRIIMDLVINHTSEHHEWFYKARNGDPKYRDWYIFAQQGDSRINSGRWRHDRFSNDFYYGLFCGTMPDLNLENPEVLEEINNIGRFWLEKGVDGFRLDAAKHMFSREENLIFDEAYNPFFWATFRHEMRKVNPNVFLIGEVMDNAATVAKYYEGLDSNFNFELSGTILNILRGNNVLYANQINRMYSLFERYDRNFIDAPFLRNHDQNRIASELDGDLEKLKLGAEMLLTLPGSPFIYYGEEIGMFGVEGGEGVWDITRRLPFIWGDDYTTTWYSNQLNQNVRPVKQQIEDENSLYNTYRRMIHVRNENIALSRGGFQPYPSMNPRLQGFYRMVEGEQKILVLHNFSNQSIDIEEFPSATLLYESLGKNGFANQQIAPNSTLILELPKD